MAAVGYDKKGKVVSIAVNSYVKSHPLQSKYANKAGLREKQCLHAEIACIIRARGVKIHTIAVARINREGQPLLAAPCAICQLAIEDYQIREVVHT